MSSEAKEIAKESKSSFYFAFNLLPASQRDAMNTVYAFCRKTDDIVDENDFSSEVKFENLHKWRVELEKGLKGESNLQLLNHLSKIINQFNIPIDPFFDLIKGMEMDIQRKWLDYVKVYADKIETDIAGNAIGIINPNAKFVIGTKL